MALECGAVDLDGGGFDAVPDGLPVGQAVVTPGFDLPAHWVIHTVGPNQHQGEIDPALLAACFTNSLDVAAEIGARSVAFPAISAGAFGWAPDDVAHIAINAVAGWRGTGVEEVRFVLFNEDLLDRFQKAAREADAGGLMAHRRTLPTDAELIEQLSLDNVVLIANGTNGRMGDEGAIYLWIARGSGLAKVRVADSHYVAGGGPTAALAHRVLHFIGEHREDFDTFYGGFG